MFEETRMLSRIRHLLATTARDEDGASMVEYMLLVVLIAMAAVVGITVFGRTTANKMNNIATTVDTAG
jgi:pilus assembly protein Flp/PilA